MSAREFLLARLIGALIPEDRANKMIDDLLHEEAEKQRSWASMYGDTHTQQAIRSIINEAADLIDPYVK